MTSACRRASDALGAPGKEGERQPAGAAFAEETERQPCLSQRLWQKGPPREALPARSLPAPPAPICTWMGPSGKGIHTLQKAILGGGLYPLFLENVCGAGGQMKDALGASLTLARTIQAS